MNSEDFLKGILIGGVIGASLGILFAPKSGKETRGKIKELASNVGDRTSEVYHKVKGELEDRISDLKRAKKDIDFEDYKKLVRRVIDGVRVDTEMSEESARKLGEKLNEDWDEVKKTLSS